MNSSKQSSDGSDQQFAVLAYGSLLAHPGEWLGCHMRRVIRWNTPFNVEYFGRSEHRGGAPTLVPLKGEQPVLGGLLVLGATETNGGKDKITLQEVRHQLALREGTRNLEHIKSDKTVLGFQVIYSSFEAHDRKEPHPDELATAAIASVGRCVAQGTPFLNGIRYLNDNLEWGVVTGLSEAYRAAILDRMKAASLEEAEHKALENAFVKQVVPQQP